MRRILVYALFVSILLNSFAYSLLGRLKGAIKNRANINVFRKFINLGTEPVNSYTGLGLTSSGSVNGSVGKLFSKEKVPVKKAMLSRLTSWLMRRAIHARTRNTRGLRININAGSSIQVAQGRLGTIEIEFDQLSSSEMQVSGGGKITISDFQVDLKRLLFHNLQFVQKPYTVFCDLQLTQEDILSSNYVKRLTQQLANTVLERALGAADILNISISKVHIEGSRIVISGQAAYPASGSAAVSTVTTTCAPSLRGSPYVMESTSDSPVHFEITSSVSLRPASDRVVLLQDLSVTMDPDYLLLRTTLPRSIELDLGEGSHVQRLHLANNMLHFAGSSRIFPDQPRQATDDVSVTPLATIPLTVTEYVAANLFSLWWASWTTAFYQFDLAKVLSSNICLNGGLLASIFRRK